MIAQTLPASQPARWQRELRHAIADLATLLRALDLPAGTAQVSEEAAREFPVRVPRGFVARMRKGDPADPLLLQVLAGAGEVDAQPGFVADPVGDLAASVKPGLLHKYRGRALLVSTGACAVHCRYCFRRHFPYADANPASAHWQQALAHLGADESITEVILSGGDPLSLSDARLAGLVAALRDIPHLRTLRIHTRMPVVLPERVDADLLRWLEAARMAVVVVIHANHPNELDEAAANALCSLRGAGATLLNQSVLLRGINDTVEVLAELSEALFQAGVLPYYLHLLDRVRGAAHFEVPADEACRLMHGLRERLPGYLVPRLVREEAGAPYKRPLCD